jgi:hypothetical protein
VSVAVEPGVIALTASWRGSARMRLCLTSSWRWPHANGAGGLHSALWACAGAGFTSRSGRKSIIVHAAAIMEEKMLSRVVSGGAIATIAGAAMLLATSGPSAAFTLSSPSLEPPVAAGDVEHVWWHRWGGWHAHPWGWHRWGWRAHPWGWHRPVYGFYGAPVRRCWVGPWGGWHCRW